jgi:hypothetical protein
VQIKGTALRSILHAIEEEGGPRAVQRVLAAVAEPMRAELSGKILATQYFPVAVHAALQEAVRTVLGQGDLAANRRIGRRAAKRDFSGVYSVFLALSDPRATLRRMERAWPRYNSQGRLEVELPGPSEGVVRVVGADGYTEAMWHAVFGRAQGVLELSGAVGVEGEVRSWSPSGVVADLRWR